MPSSTASNQDTSKPSEGFPIDIYTRSCACQKFLTDAFIASGSLWVWEPVLGRDAHNTEASLPPRPPKLHVADCVLWEELLDQSKASTLTLWDTAQFVDPGHSLAFYHLLTLSGHQQSSGL